MIAKPSPSSPAAKLAAAFALALIFAFPASAADRRPNVVFFLIDDLGYRDIGANNPGTFYDTPHIDGLANSGINFTHGYAANPVCSPTRFSIMTGKYPTRHDATNFFSGTREARLRPAPLNDSMPLDEVTLAEALKEAGYSTCFLGKWHLGPDPELWPENQGFDHNFGGHKAGSPPGGFFSPYKNPRLEDGPPGEHLPARLGDEALRFIHDHEDEPFFLFFSFYSVHTPLQAPDHLIEKYEIKASSLPEAERAGTFAPEEQVWPEAKDREVRIKQNHPTYAAMVAVTDAQVGRVLSTLKDLGLEDDTLVIFTSDNGGLSTSEGSPTANFPLRGGKGWVYEGGIRVPLLIRWPAGGAAGAICDTPVISNDFFPTILDLCGLPPRPDQHLDGVSLKPLIENPDASLDRDALFWHYPHYSNQGGFPGGAVREGPWKLVERYEDGRTHLYNLNDDPGERNDLAATHPDKTTTLTRKLHAWYGDVDAKFLRPKDGADPWRGPAE